MTENKSIVYLIGSGPGDPGLLTLKALHCIQSADIIIYDYLASTAFLHHLVKKPELIYAGKKGGDHTLTQDQINDLLVEKGRQGLTVARLKGGDPFIFGRGGEEAQILQKHGIPFEIIPGVTSAIAAPAYAGIPLTHRDFVSSVTFITGHEDPEKKSSSHNWQAYAQSGGTLVFLMGVKNLPHIVKSLVENGRPASTPVALVRWGTTARQQTVTGTLETIVDDVHKAALKAPAVIIVGDVTTLRSDLQWFENKPLFGKRIVVTRARAQASDLVSRLAALGADCIEIPTIRITSVENNQNLIDAVHAIERYHWLIFTSVNGVDFFFDTLYVQGKDVRVLSHLQFACIGPATKDRLKSHGIIADILPETYRAESVIKAFKDKNITGKEILIPRAMEARTILPAELKKMGALVHEVAAYVTVTENEKKDELVSLIEKKKIDMVTFTSSSTVKNFISLLPHGKHESLMEGVRTASIGPITEKTAAALGISIDVSAGEYTIPGLVDAIVDYYTSDK